MVRYFCQMKFKIDNLQYCNWSRKFEINLGSRLDAVHMLVYHEDFDEFLTGNSKMEKLFEDNSDLIFRKNKGYRKKQTRKRSNFFWISKLLTDRG